MTENEAKKILYTMRLAAGLDDFEKPGGVPVPLTKEELAAACKLAIKALGEVQQYRTIGTSMGRLIDEGELIKVLEERATNEAICGYMTAYDVTNSIIDEVKEQPTAYDLDKVVEQIEEDKKHTFDGCINKRKAIEIVKGGGVDAD